ncbi:MAG: cobalamin B12-binding domain-containing protein [Deltaproteobacteria bacterium]
MKERKLRVMVAKPGLDGHDRRTRIIARAFRDAGLEVVYTGVPETPESVVLAAIQEDVDLLVMSSPTGAHRHLFAEVVRFLRQKGGDDIVVCGGGFIPDEDIPRLKESGIAEVFTPDSKLDDIVTWVKEHVKPRVA